MRRFLACLLALTLTLAACEDQQAPTTVATDAPPISGDITDVVDGSTTGNADFLWLPPLVNNNSPGAPVTSGLSLVIEICAQDPPADSEHCGENALVASRQGQKYQANWNTSRADGGEAFDVRVRAEDENGSVLGSLVVTLETDGPQWAGRTIPIKFWIGGETGDCLGDDRCNVGTFVGGEGGLVEVEDEEGNTIAFADFPEGWDPAGEGSPGRTVIVDCRDDSFDPPAGPLNTTLDQLPLYCEFTLKPPLGPQEEFEPPVHVGICEIQSDPHGPFVVLGQQDAEGTFLFPEPESTGLLLSDCGEVSYPDVAFGFWEGASRFASMLDFLGPQPLAAGDGGVGGLVRSFSLINPVVPVYVAQQGEGVDEKQYPVVPLVGATDVESFYGYGTLPDPAGASSNTGLEQSDKSILFLYQDDEGSVSLVMIHDKANDGSGGKVEFSFGGSLIDDLEEPVIDFIVRDDSNAPCSQEEGPAEASLPDSCWKWNDDNTDGGALGPFDDDFTLTIDPDFPASGGLSPGQIDDWILLSFPDGTAGSVIETTLSKAEQLRLIR